MNRKIIELTLSILTMVFAFISWWSVARIFDVSGASSWTSSMISFIFYLVLICLDIALFTDIVLLELLLTGSLVLGVVFTGSLWHLLGAIIGSYFLFLSSRKIRRDFKLNVKIDFQKSLRAGKAMMILAISLVISVQYFSIVNRLDGQILIPRMAIGGISSKIALKILSLTDQNFKSLENANITVDDFILQTQKNQIAKQNLQTSDSSVSQMVEQELDKQNISPADREQLRAQAADKINNLNSQINSDEQALILKGGRDQLSTLVGRNVQGSENVSNVMAELVSKKIENTFTPSVTGQQRSSSFAGVLAGILFFTVLSIGSLLSFIFFGLSWLIFLLLTKFKFIEIKTITVEKEIIL